MPTAWIPLAKPTEQEVTKLLPGELLKMAREWRKDPEGVIARLQGRNP